MKMNSQTTARVYRLSRYGSCAAHDSAVYAANGAQIVNEIG
jgi:hypothetical protein